MSLSRPDLKLCHEMFHIEALKTEAAKLLQNATL
jgi:hypothetical protein